jgi:hypothetical protein
MPTKGTSVKGIRLPDSIWEAVDADAAELGFTRSEWFRRRLVTRFIGGQEVRETDHKGDHSDIRLED